MDRESPPPQVARYLAPPPAEAAEFDFLIGEWRVEGARYDAAGGVEFAFQGRWRAEQRHGRRLLIDDFAFLSPTGEELSAFVTLRTYAALSGRWEIAGLYVGEPGLDGKWSGGAVGDEMHLFVEARTPEGTPIHARERFCEIAADRFRWENHISHDGRATWRLTSALVARRA